MKKKYTITLLIFLSIFLISNIFSSWIVSFPFEGETEITTSSDFPVAYIERNGEVREYISIESALLEAENGDIVNVYLDDSYVGSKIITKNCVIKEGVTLNIAHENDSSSGTLQYNSTAKNEKGEVINVRPKVLLQENMKTNDTNMDQSLAEKDKNKLKNTIEINDDILVINQGTIIIGGILSGGAGNSAYCGQTSGDYGKIQLGNNAKIISYGEIRCCGYITESSLNNGSSIEIKEGSLKIPFLVRDFCGGTDTYAIYEKRSSYYISPFNQFELRNIQCEYKIYYNGCMYGCSNISLGGETYFNEIKFIENSSNSFFALDNINGYASIKYNKEKEIMNFNFYGGATINNITLNLKISLFSVNINLNDYYFPLSWRVNITLNPLPGQNNNNNDNLVAYTSSEQKIKLMPGAKLTVEEGASFTVPAMNVYTFYSDCRDGIGGQKYNTGYTDSEIIPPAEFYVNGIFDCQGDFGGRIIKGHRTMFQ